MQKRTQRFDPRQTMNSNSYEIFHYLDAKSRHLDAHYHDFYEVFCFIDGDVDYWVDGSLYHLKQGDILLINPTELHKPVPRTESEKYERIVLWIDKNYLSQIENGIFEKCFDLQSPTYNKILRLSANDKNTVYNMLGSFTREFYSGEYASKSCSYGMLLQFLTLINRISQEEVSSDNYKTPTFIAEILAYIGEHYSEELSLDRLANHFFISKYYLSHEFKKAVGTSVHRYITLKRLSIAYDLLSDGISPNQVGIMCGFNDYTSFFRAFKARYDVTPASVNKSVE